MSPKSGAKSIRKMTLKKGDKVLYGKYSGSEIDGGELLIMRESDILATL